MSVSDSSTEVRKLIGGNDEDEGGENEFDPIPYTFRIPEKWKKAGESTILSPPHWLLLDHTIAVVWCLFSTFTPAKSLDIEDLKWAHEFLKEVRNTKGEIPPDVKTCLTEIQDRLIALYAQLTHPKEEKAKEQPGAGGATIVAEEALPLSRQKTNLIEPAKEMKREKAERKESTRELKPEAAKKQTISLLRDPKKPANAQQRRVTVAQTKAPVPAKRSEPVRKESSVKKEEGDTPENFFTEVFQRNRAGDRILNAHPATRKRTSPTNVDQSQKEFSDTSLRKELSQADDGKISLQIKWITEEESNNEEKAYRRLKNEIRNLMKNPKISKDEILKFMSNWREKQVERLQSELKRLNSIEEFMKSLNVDGFTPYVHEDLAARLESLT